MAEFTVATASRCPPRRGASPAGRFPTGEPDRRAPVTNGLFVSIYAKLIKLAREKKCEVGHVGMACMEHHITHSQLDSTFVITTGASASSLASQMWRIVVLVGAFTCNSNSN